MYSIKNLKILISLLVIFFCLKIYQYMSIPKLEIYTVKPEKLVGQLSTDGTVKINDMTVISSRIGGLIKYIYHDAGDYVKQGDILLKLDNRDLVVELKKAKKNVDILKAEKEKLLAGSSEIQEAKSDLNKAKEIYLESKTKFEEVEKSFKNNVATQEELSAAKKDMLDLEKKYMLTQKRLNFVLNYDLAIIEEKIKQAEIILESAKNNCEDATIVSPCTGTIIEKKVDKGLFINSGTALFKIADLSTLKIQANVDESDILNIKIGQKAIIKGRNLYGRSIVGEVVSIEHLPIESEKEISGDIQYNVNIKFLNTNDITLNDGMSVDVTIVTIDKSNIFIVPNTALINMKKQYYIFINQNGRARLKSVKPGLKNLKYIEIIDGLKNGDKVVLSPPKKLIDGKRIKIKASYN